MIQRLCRTFAVAAAAAGAAFLTACAGSSSATSGHAGADRAPEPMKILILGGTGFIGPHMVEYAQSRGHEITLFNRGRTNSDLFPGVTKLVGDRDDTEGDGLSALREADTHWDAVIDNSGYITRHVRDSANILSDKADRYLFISSISVYPDLSVVGLDEDSEVGTLDDPTVEEVTGETYGPLKAYCEDAVRDAFGDRATVVRPGLIVGPGDPTDRFTYWPVRVSKGGELLAPGDSDDPVQFIDARDLARFVVGLLESDTGGTYNACGPAGVVTIGELIAACEDASGAEVSEAWVPAEYLLENGIRPWGQMPMWAPRDGEAGGINQASNARAIRAGLTFRPMSETVADVLAWFPGERESDALRAGWSMPEEAEMLEAWRAHEAGEDHGHDHDGHDHGDHDGHDH